MRFPDFYGNPLLKQRLNATFAHGKAGHCFILSGKAGLGKHTLSRIMAAALQCTGEGDRPCCSCSNCRKVMAGIHPDVITIDSDKATVPVDLIREMRSDAFIAPNEGRRKLYIIPRAQDMQDAAQNALLKILEEPPEYCTFLLLTDSADKLLTTVRSRAVELQLSPLTDADLLKALRELRPSLQDETLRFACEHAEGCLGEALSLADSGDAREDPRIASLISAYAESNALAILELLIPMERQDRQALLRFVSQLYQEVIKAIRFVRAPESMLSAGTRPLCSLPLVQLVTLTDALAEIIALLQANGNVGGCVGLLLAALTP